MVLCNNNAAAEQWRRSFEEFTDIPLERLILFHAKSKPERLPNPCVLITTYSILAQRKEGAGSGAYRGEQAQATADVLAMISGTAAKPREWALMVLDEVSREGGGRD